MFDDSGRESASFADFPVGGVVFELKREELEGKLVKISEGRAPIQALKFGVRPALRSLRAKDGSSEFGVRASWNSALRKNEFAQTRGKV